MNFSGYGERNRLLKIILLFVLAHSSVLAYSLESVITTRPHSDSDKRLDYSFDLLTLALKATESTYGAFDIRRSDREMFRERQFQELLRGKILNVMVSPPKKDWGDRAIRIKFPIQKGLASFRLALILEKNKALLKQVSTLEALKKVPLGANNHWTTTIVLRDHHFNVVAGESYLSLFDMLKLERFDYFPRGLNEIYPEYEVFKTKIPGLMIEQHTAVVMYLPSYFYVSPRVPALAVRLEAGLKMVAESGEFDALFNQYFGDTLEKANLGGRKIFYVENRNLEPQMLERDTPYLLDYFKALHKIEKFDN